MATNDIRIIKLDGSAIWTESNVTATATSVLGFDGSVVPAMYNKAALLSLLNVADGANVNVYASASEVTTGSEAAKSVSPDALAGSTIFGVKVVQIVVFDFTTDWATGDGKAYFVVPACLNGMNLIRVHARVITAGTTNTSDIQLRNVTDSQDMLSTKITIDSTETGSDTAAAAAVINATYDDVATNDLIAVDIDAASTTKPKGLILTMEFQLA